MAEFNINANLNVDGTIAVGTTNPLTKLEVKEAGTNIGVTITNSTEALGNTSGLYFKEAGSTADYRKAAIIFENDGTGNGLGDLHLAVNNSATSAAVTKADAKLTILHEGNVGIGTTNPAQDFVVADATNGNGMEFAAGATATIQNYNRGTSSYNNINIDTNSARIRSLDYTAFYNGTFTSESMRIDSAGKVGIGTDNPSAKLVVKDSQDAAFNKGIAFERSNTTQSGYLNMVGGAMNIVSYDNLPIKFRTGSNATNTPMTIEAGGNVGIGTDTPMEKLDTPNIVIGGANITGTTRANSLLIDNLTGTSRFYSTGADSTTYGSYQWNIASSNASLNTTAMVIDTDGNVGIGTISPDTKLHVEGNVLIDAYSQGEDNGLFFREGFLTIDQPSITVWDMSNSGASPDGLSINSFDGIRFRENGGEVARFKDGFFGIGTISPQSSLQVDGGVQMADDTDTASLSKVGTMRYRSDASNSYVDMCMQTGISTYAWINIVQNNF